MPGETLSSFLGIGARRFEATSSQQAELDEAGSVLLVETGSLDVFVHPTKDGKPSGRRLHLFRAGPGDLLFSLPDEAGEIRLVAAGFPGTTVVRFQVSRLEEAGRRLEELPELSEAVERWVVHLSESLALVPPPRRFQEAIRGAEFRLEPGGVLRALDVAWLQPAAGELLFLGERRASTAPGGVLPLTAATWVTAGGEARGTVHDTRERIRAASIEEDLRAFHALALEILRGNLATLDEAQRRKAETKRRRESASGEEALRALASVLEEVPGTGSAAPAAEEDLLRACRLVGEAQGISLEGPREESAASTSVDPLRRIAKASRVRVRQVALRGAWWRDDAGPLLVYRLLDEEGKTRRPAALLPASATAYDLVDPVEGSRVRVTPAIAARIDGFAYMFFRSLPTHGIDGRTLWSLGLSRSGKDVWTVLAMGLAGSLLGLLVPVLTGYLFGTVIPGAEYGLLAQLSIGLLVSAMSASLFEITRAIATVRVEGRLDNILQSALWDRLLSLPVAFFRRYTVGDLATRTMAISLIRQTLGGNAVRMALAAVFSVFNILLLFYYSWRLALVATGVVTLLLGVTLLLTLRQLRHLREIQALQGETAGLVLQLLDGIAKLRVSAAEARAFSVWSTRFRQQRSLVLEARRAANLVTALSSVGSILASMTVFACVQWWLREQGAFDTGDFLAFNAALGQVLAAAFSMAGVLSTALAVVPLYERMKPILEASPEVDSEKADPGELSGRLELSHVSFRYQGGGSLVLSDVSLDARPGEFVAVVGPSGSGKSTLLRLILGFEHAEVGTVSFDGQNLSGLDVQAVRSQIGVVLQGGRLMVGDIFSNIVGSAAHLTLEDAWEAARMAGLERDIKAMPMGMQTAVSEGAATFSGGQRQRLMIARAIVNRPRILLFDEATSALDNRTQRIVSESLESLAATRIVVAHRLSTVLHADRIYAMQAGRVVETGTYEELMQKGGAFADLVRRQIA